MKGASGQTGLTVGEGRGDVVGEDGGGAGGGVAF